ncbi:class I SAM-dependent methyltransferase [Mycobacterium talmoniae]|uniref:S-adenosyl-L-methionine-dependent methyltransferase n=1 Tax=Mycobacterium talmoniae TaxID=1858794 RepID=A0A1S1NLU8_9MYCO|nr:MULTISPECIES: SAM-dependent methyltransferase [Mycobacterium]OHV05076.1 methyltransferase [Mycobacterium talmoniae]PQM45440.1 Putative S-adenosyl-L-methionine-dependent methyltransferase [Mycobacterium talmoniae]TDH56161.1 class I SAM-dependent methyltransferase [Mycobacterium eburneum]
MSEPLIGNVSDTARWMASYRAAETRRPDALFHDPFADRLAGDRGRAIAATAPRLARNGWWWITRTKLIDDLVAESVKNGCDRVLNLATGFDTRPYRLELPNSLDWIEADLPQLIQEKNRLLTGETARCQLSRVAVDLADAPSRTAFLADATSGARNTVVITEGLLLYLSQQQAGALAEDLHRKEIGGWITDVIAPAIVRRMMRQMPSLDKAPMMFEPTDGVAFFEQRGWSVGTVQSILKYARRWRRLPAALRPVAYLPDPNPRRLSHAPWSGVVRFHR